MTVIVRWTTGPILGGGPGMLMKSLSRCWKPLRLSARKRLRRPGLIYLSTPGPALTQSNGRQELPEMDSLRCCYAGRYEGCRRTLIEMCVDEESPFGGLLCVGGELGHGSSWMQVTRLSRRACWACGFSGRRRFFYGKGGWLVRITPGRKSLKSGDVTGGACQW